MRPAGRLTLRYTAWTIAPLCVLAIALGLMWAAAGLWVAAVFSVPWLAWRYDNDSGTFLVFALLFLLIIGVTALLLFLMAVAHR
jgi:hypothetical protein